MIDNCSASVVHMSDHACKRMGIHWVDRSWVSAIYSVSIQNKNLINSQHLLGNVGVLLSI